MKMKSSINVSTWLILSFLIIIGAIQCKSASINIEPNISTSSATSSTPFETNPGDKILNVRINEIFPSNEKDNDLKLDSPQINLKQQDIKEVDIPKINPNDQDLKANSTITVIHPKDHDLKVDASAINQPVFYTSGIFNGLFNVQKIYTLP